MLHGRAIIIGAGPAGLTAAHELAEKTDITPVVLEKSDLIGGIARTVNYKGNRIDIGGHRFFSKSDRVMDWWLRFFPLQAGEGDRFAVSYQGKTRDVETGAGVDPDREDRVMLVRRRKSRIYYMRRFFDYPISLSPDTLMKLGLPRTLRIGFSYLGSILRPIRNEQSLEDFFINRFGRELYNTFFKSYTEKVWGVPCRDISAEWGAQRIKGLSIGSAVAHFLRSCFRRRSDIAQKETETSLIEQFLYPKYGPGQMWEAVAERVREQGGEVHLGRNVVGLVTADSRVKAVEVEIEATGRRETVAGDFFFSTMPVQDLARALTPPPPDPVREVAEGLVYRDFITVGLLVDALKVKSRDGKMIDDNWIYIQEPDVRVGRLQIFNNWSPYMVADPATVWLGLEYFCSEGDDLWTKSDAALAELGGEELERIGIIDRAAVRDATVIRMPKTYPAYFGTYDSFATLREYTDGFANLFLVGRNGMHRYNNQDHSMLTAMVAVDNIAAGRVDKAAIWDVNVEQDYHEEKR